MLDVVLARKPGRPFYHVAHSGLDSALADCRGGFLLPKGLPMTYRQIIDLAAKRKTYIADKFAQAAKDAAFRRGDSLDDIAI